MDKKDLDILKVTKWECPDEVGVPLITMPNIPKPLHGKGCQPRTIMGSTKWDKTRKLCYFKANYKCEICGCDPAKGDLHSHELFSVDYLEGYTEFKRYIALCRTCHDAIHSGRLITLYKEGNLMYPKSYVLKVVEHAFSLVHKYNKENPEANLRLFDTFVEYLKVPELKSEMLRLIQKYNIKFYKSPKRCAKWPLWRMIWNGKEYKTPYATPEDWLKAMETASKNDTARKVKDRFTGGIFDEIDKIIAENA